MTSVCHFKILYHDGSLGRQAGSQLWPGLLTLLAIARLIPSLTRHRERERTGSVAGFRPAGTVTAGDVTSVCRRADSEAGA
jgi:hypothetical protein